MSKKKTSKEELEETVEETVEESTEELVDNTEEVEAAEEEKFIFDGKEYKTESAMKAAITRAKKAEAAEKESEKAAEAMKLNCKHNGKLYVQGKVYKLSPELEKHFKSIGVL